jgi:hypothetical protein
MTEVVSENPEVTVLLVEDNPQNLNVLRAKKHWILLNATSLKWFCLIS